MNKVFNQSPADFLSSVIVMEDVLTLRKCVVHTLTTSFEMHGVAPYM